LLSFYYSTPPPASYLSTVLAHVQATSNHLEVPSTALFALLLLLLLLHLSAARSPVGLLSLCATHIQSLLCCLSVLLPPPSLCFYYNDNHVLYLPYSKAL
jgi:hypothetical protein